MALHSAQRSLARLRGRVREGVQSQATRRSIVEVRNPLPSPLPEGRGGRSEHSGSSSLAGWPGIDRRCLRLTPGPFILPNGPLSRLRGRVREGVRSQARLRSIVGVRNPLPEGRGASPCREGKCITSATTTAAGQRKDRNRESRCHWAGLHRRAHKAERFIRRHRRITPLALCALRLGRSGRLSGISHEPAPPRHAATPKPAAPSPPGRRRPARRPASPGR